MSARFGLSSVWVVGLWAAAMGRAMPAEAPPAGAESPQLKPTTIEVRLLDPPPAVDGRLDDPAWQQASRFEGFWRNDIGFFETERTEGWVGCTREALYFALYCHDSQPEQIRAVVRQRGAYFSNEDCVTLVLDVRRDRRDAFFYRFRVNARGTQNDVIPGGSAAKIEWRGDWRAAAQRVADGWTVEIEIPFEILKYPKGQTCFAFNLARHITRRDEWVGWPYLGRSWAPQYMADLTGLALPEPDTAHAGGIMVFDPWGDVIAQSQTKVIEDEMVVCDLDAEALDRRRSGSCFPLTVRRPEIYGDLCKPTE